MNRRTFFKRLMVGSAVIAAAPALLAELPQTAVPAIAANRLSYATIALTATVVEYSDYITFDNLEIEFE